MAKLGLLYLSSMFYWHTLVVYKNENLIIKPLLNRSSPFLPIRPLLLVVVQSSPTLCDPADCSRPGFPTSYLTQIIPFPKLPAFHSLYCSLSSANTHSFVWCSVLFWFYLFIYFWLCHVSCGILVLRPGPWQ